VYFKTTLLENEMFLVYLTDWKSCVEESLQAAGSAENQVFDMKDFYKNYSIVARR
jgi:hypothetical protein